MNGSFNANGTGAPDFNLEIWRLSMRVLGAFGGVVLGIFRAS